MGKITLSKEDRAVLESIFPGLIYDQTKDIISGTLSFDLTYPETDGIRIQGRFDICISLEKKEGSVLPTIFETAGKIAQIAKRKCLKREDLHLNNDNGELCIIIPPKESERYPDGFNLNQYLRHLQEHFYWVTYYDRYEKPPWKECAHGDLGYVQLYVENKSKYGVTVKQYFEKKNNVRYSRQQFRELMRRLKKKL